MHRGEKQKKCKNIKSRKSNDGKASNREQRKKTEKEQQVKEFILEKQITLEIMYIIRKYPSYPLSLLWNSKNYLFPSSMNSANHDKVKEFLVNREILIPFIVSIL